MIEKWVPHWQMAGFNKHWWVTSAMTNKWHSYRCVCARISFVRAYECHLFVFAKMKKRCLRNKKNRTSIDNRTTKVPKGRWDHRQAVEWAERTEPLLMGCNPCPSPDGATDSFGTHPPSESVTPSEFRSGCSTSAGVPSFQDSTACL